MRLLSFLTGLTGFFLAGALAAQTPGTPPAPPPLEAGNAWHLDLSTGGRVTIQLRPDVAPEHVERIRTLTRQGFYDGTVFHRVIEGFMAQGGDPTATGNGGSELPDLAAEIRGLPHLRGSVGMARGQEMNSANSQFYIMFVPRLSMDRNYTVFGRVVSGMGFVDAVERGEPPLSPTRIVRASIGSDNVPEFSAEELRAAAARQAQAASPPPGLAGIIVPPQPSAQAAAVPPRAPAATPAAEAGTVTEEAPTPAPAAQDGAAEPEATAEGEDPPQ
jgi:peptidylprolyl isomerase